MNEGWLTQHRFNQGEKQNQRETHSAGVHITVDGDRLDAHLATGLDHLIKIEKNRTEYR